MQSISSLQLLLACSFYYASAKKEYVTFINDNKSLKPQYQHVDYSYLTSLVICDDVPRQEFMDFVLTKNPNVKFQRLIGDPVSATGSWEHYSHIDFVVDQLVESVIAQNISGINIDIEGAYYKKSVNDGIVYFVKTLYQKLKATNPEYILTYDVPYDPQSIACITGRCQEWTEMAKYVDYFYVMDYDAQLERIFVGECTDPIERISAGMEHYLNKFQIPAEKLVNLINWNGQKYKCFNRPKFTTTCFTNTITKVTGLGMCQQYYQIKKSLKDGFKIIKNDYQDCYHIFWRNDTTGDYYQIWFDDVNSLTDRMGRIALDNDLGGIGFFGAMSVEHPDDLDEECQENFIGPFWRMMQDMYLKLSGLATGYDNHDRKL